ncbi:MAG: AAA family ATPase [Methanosphaera sp. rholeuAM130]|nr:MAG: AAA family ATPase [Methanosphaera sp. rholeuAM130]
MRQDNQYGINKQARYEIINEKKEAKVIILQAIGYPIESNYIESPEIEVTNKELFDIYANDQWNGYKVHKYQYLFDQKLLPDFAYQILDVRPDNSYITSNTSFLVLPREKRSIENSQKQKFKVDDVIGQKKAKDKSRIITKYLEDPDKFKNWAPKNILFYGMPGTGKTMLAQALANELDVPIKMIKATSLIGDHVGDGSKQIHELYEEARNNKPTVIFIDEIDAIGLERKYQSLRGDVTEIVNALLTEMDGIEDNESIITICATNNPQLLDYAIRSRFEEEIEFSLPSKKDRLLILKTNIETLPLKASFDVENLVEKTDGFSGRDLKEKILKTALHRAISESCDEIREEHVNYALEESKKEVKTIEDKMFG